MARSLASPPLLRPADGLVGAIPVAMLAIWILNDHVLKAAWPGLVTGKLSDVAGLVVVPLAIQAAVEVVQWSAGRWTGPSPRVLAVAMAIVAIGFAAVQVWPPATDAYRWGLGAAQWPVRALGGAFADGAAAGIVPVQATADAGDLVALPIAIVLTWLAWRRRMARPG